MDGYLVYLVSSKLTELVADIPELTLIICLSQGHGQGHGLEQYIESKKLHT